MNQSAEIRFAQLYDQGMIDRILEHGPEHYSKEDVAAADRLVTLAGSIASTRSHQIQGLASHMVEHGGESTDTDLFNVWQLVSDTMESVNEINQLADDLSYNLTQYEIYRARNKGVNNATRK